MKGRAFLPAPHLKVGGLAGVVASFGYHKEGLDRVSVSEIGYASPGLRRRASLRWKAAFDDHPVKAYVGCSLSAQVGRMRKRLLSFTSVMAQCECTVPVALGQSAFSRRLQTVTIPSRRNLMIGPVPLRPLMNFSFTQQVPKPKSFLYQNQICRFLVLYEPKRITEWLWKPLIAIPACKIFILAALSCTSYRICVPQSSTLNLVLMLSYLALKAPSNVVDGTHRPRKKP